MSAKMSLAADNLLKLIIALLIGVLSFIGNDLRESVQTLEIEVANLKTTVAEIKTEIKYLTANGRQAAK